jgi:V/A-type H+-transporting ATPase subunit I
MIIKMDKYSFVLFHADLPGFLEKLQEIGVVDITRENKAVDDTSRELFSLAGRYSKVIKGIESIKSTLSETPAKKDSAGNPYDELSQKELLIKVETLLNKKEQLKQDLEGLKRDFSESKQWGALHQEDIDKLRSLGYNLHLYTVTEKNFDNSWEDSYPLQVLNKNNGRVYFALLSNNDQEFKFPLPESKLPQKSYDIVEKQISLVSKEIQENDKSLSNCLALISKLERAMEETKQNLDLYLAGASSVKEAEGSIAVLTGFAPVDNREDVNKALANEGVYYMTDQAQETDNPPVKLKNGFFARLYEPIGELYMLPKYGELDLTPYFAPFYMLFFGLCLGDMGYGLAILIGAGLAKYKLPKFKSYLTLAQFLGLGAVIMASLSGVFFGTKIQEILPLPDSVKDLFFSDLKMFWFAILFGLVQIVFARMLNAIYLIIKKGWQYGMHNIGWSILITWASWYYATTMVDTLTMPSFMNYVAMAGAALVLLFTSDSGNIFTRLFKGASAFYDVTSIFGDMLSYIRLFGLGTAGAILGMVVNSVAMSLTGIPYLGWFFAGLMLVFGHILVLLLSSLGAFVHPMRLTFVEFYKNASFDGGGRAFRPLGKESK